MAAARKGGAGFDVDSMLNFEKRSGIKDGEIETFISKVDAVNAAIKAMKDGEIDPADVHVDGVPTIEEERQMEEDRRRRRLELAKRERENRERQKRQENEKWWSGAELLFGERKGLSGAMALKESSHRDPDGTKTGRGGDTDKDQPSTRSLSEEERSRLKERYSMEYSRWDTWTPTDPATLAEMEEREEEEERKKSREFEESNPEFCKQMVDDMKVRAEARDSEANTARLKGNRFYKAKRWEKALELYMTSLKSRPYAVNTLANIAQTLIKLERWLDAVEFCNRALHVDEKCVKALSRRATAFVKLAGDCPASVDVITSGANRSAPATPTVDVPHHGSASVGSSHNEIDLVIERGNKGPIDISSCNSTGGNVDEGVGEKEDRSGATSEKGGEKRAFQEYFGGRQGLMARALLDLDAAVESDPDGEDVRRQRDTLRQEIEEEKAEAEVMKKMRENPGVHVRRSVGHEAPTHGGKARTSPGAKTGRDFATEHQDTRERHANGVTEVTPGVSSTTSTQGRTSPASEESIGRAVGSQDDLETIGKILDEALGDVGKGAANVEVLRRDSFLRLASILEDNSTARVYFRASGGLSRLAEASALFAAAHLPSNSSASLLDSNEAGTRATTLPNPAAAVEVENVVVGSEDDWSRLALMLRAVSAALTGGERLAQKEVLKSGLLDGLCAQAMRKAFEKVQGDVVPPAVTAVASAAGASALLLSLVVDDISVRTHIARNTDLLSGLVSLISAAGSIPPPDVESAADTLRSVLIGRTAQTAAKTLSVTAAQAKAASTVGGTAQKRTGCPTKAVGEALLAWKNGNGLMKGAPVSTGLALCSVLANLAMNEQFREGFSTPSLAASAAGDDNPNGNGGSTVAGALVLIAGDTTAARSEVRTVALAALSNACLHNHSVQVATLEAGGLAIALATLSLEGQDRALYASPLVAARSAGLLARLSSLPSALQAMARPGVVNRIIRAVVRSSTLGGNLSGTGIASAVAAVDLPCGASEDNPTATTAAAHITERENLVRTLGSILRSKVPSSPVNGENRNNKAGTSPAPSSNVPEVSLTGDAKGYIAVTSEKLNLAGALVSFLPPAREDGVEGVTRTSVALRPEWCAPTAVSANACVCLLHLLDGEHSRRIGDQVVAAGGIPRLISLFANSGGEGGALSARTNAAICLAKLAREPCHKQRIADLRGMEMLVQAGAGLAAKHDKKA